MENLKKEKSCGCIIIENDEVLLIKQTKGHWGFPKGHVEENETEIEAALREVKEETNIDVKIICDKKFATRYITDKGIDKEVIFFIAKKVSGSEKNQEAEVQKIKWFKFDEAFEIITFEDTKKILREVLEEINFVKDSKKI